MTETITTQHDLTSLAAHLAATIIQEVRQILSPKDKDWYTVNELADALGKARYSIRENWCHAGRIECIKDMSGKWLIPGHEYKRLLNGGLPKGRTFSTSPLAAMLQPHRN